MAHSPLPGPLRDALRPLTVACVPAASTLGAEGWRRAEAIVAEALAPRPPGVRRQIALFVRVVGLVAFLRYGRRLESLAPERLRALLAALERSPLLLLRRGTWGLRTLAFMGYYAQAEVRLELGYGATLRGWDDRGTKQGPWPERRGAGAPEPFVLTADPVDRPHA